MSKISGLVLRNARRQDIPLIFSFIRELADYERLTEEVKVTEVDLEEHLFGKSSSAEVVIAEYKNEPVGFALFFSNFSTFLGKPGIYLEDLFVRVSARGKGIGRALVTHLAGVARERNCGRLEWSVLNWNQSAIEFYRRLGAVPLKEWTAYRLTGKALQKLGSATDTALGAD